MPSRAALTTESPRSRPILATPPQGRLHGGPLKPIFKRKKPREDAGKDTIVRFLSSPDLFTTTWTAEERTAQRRIVRFERELDVTELRIRSRTVSQAHYTSHRNDREDGAAYISCIFFEEKGRYYFTSVDIINLLEALEQAQFKVEEKNRIRRNLEGLRPITLSKSNKQTKRLFEQVMSYAEPLPRKIEKDIKVFEWSCLEAAVDRVFSKKVCKHLIILFHCSFNLENPVCVQFQ